MTIFFQILFWLSVFAIFHSYVLFPFILKLLAKNKTQNKLSFKKNEKLPTVSIILASYNEENSIENKIKSTFNTNYPIDKIEFLIGSDNSSDNTNEIIENYSKKYPQIKFYNFKERQGKIKIINKLFKDAKNDILIFTDTKVFFRKETIFNLIKHFKNNEIDLVGGVLINNKLNKEGIAIQEDAYMNREMQIKHNEGIIWGCSMGVFGAIYAIRPNKFYKIPENFKVDDFFITLKVLEEKGKVIFAKDAIADEKLAGNINEEFKRKVRISTGNFQNLFFFKKMLLNIFSTKSYTYISHKVLRWLGPFFIISIMISLLFLLNIKLYQIFSILFLFTLLIPIIDFLLTKINFQFGIFRFISHFYSMNIALAIGFFKYLKGVENAIWEPSKRH